MTPASIVIGNIVMGHRLAICGLLFIIGLTAYNSEAQLGHRVNDQSSTAWALAKFTHMPHRFEYVERRLYLGFSTNMGRRLEKCVVCPQSAS